MRREIIETEWKRERHISDSWCSLSHDLCTFGLMLKAIEGNSFFVHECASSHALGQE